ncbi:beta-N-acetylhexosaminidase [Terasakiella sp. A23]|uniref:beta-N-acetylhexosaminidase n=1 Tax=Terasakiella sp. FCG-A23 TaxID=3080561 RepID=UPI0029538BFD|nr:beta-N-acetylhexosaminidase [Terasakiella sp. A23]MDV7338766.1 beta-N-acetylhexosaminidase [Terasakiella sp. A23]
MWGASLSAYDNSNPAAAIFGCGGLELTDWERDFFRDLNPLGFILFARNIEDPYQVQALTDDLRSCVTHPDVPILIDQEGGRVARLRPPHWREAPTAAKIGELAVFNLEMGLEAAHLNARLFASELMDLGINVDCAPVLDIPVEDADPIISDRAYAPHPELAAVMGRAACRGFMAGGVLPVIKHIPGHGRALVDSHKALPVVDTAFDILDSVDFRPFVELADMPWAMTAHIVYSDIDQFAPATMSPRLIEDVIRHHIGFNGILISDDLSMHALEGDFSARAETALEAGCDLVLHCNGNKEEMLAVADGLRPISDGTDDRLEAGWKMTRENLEEIDFDQAENRFNTLMELVT